MAKYGSFKYGDGHLYGSTDMQFVRNRTAEDERLRRRKMFINAEDFNRIEKNIGVVLEMLEEAGATIPEYTIKTDWAVGDIPTRTDTLRISNNTLLILRVFNQLHVKPASYSYFMWFSKINRTELNGIEQGLYDEYQAIRRYADA